MKHVNYLIIGAGVTGLSFANFIEDDNYLIIEKEDEIGGYCKTITKDGFIWDYSGHFFHFQHNDIKNYVISRMQENSLLEVKKNSKIYYNDRFIDFPFQKNIHQLEKDEFIQCLYDLYFKNETTDYNTFEEMVYGKFGKGISDKFLIPYNEKLYACSLNKLDSEAMGRFFPYTNVNEVIGNFVNSNNQSYNSTFIYPKNGAMEFIKALARDINKEKILTNEIVKEIDVNNKILKTSKRTLSYSHLISTIPFPNLLSLIDYKYNPQEYSWNKVLVFNLGFDKKGPNDLHWIYFPEKKYRFYRIGFYDNILQSNRMSLYVEIGMEKDEPINIQRELSEVVNNLKEIGLVTNHKLLSYIPLVLNPAYVHITSSSNQSFKKITNSLNKRNIYTIGRYGGWKYCSIEDNIIEAKELAESFNMFH